MIELFSFALGITFALAVTFIFILCQGHQDMEAYTAVDPDIDQGTGLPYQKPELGDFDGASAES
jgi:hypothetical protein